MSNAPEKCLVIIDDEPAYLEQLKEIMSDRIGRPVVTFTRPQAALEALPALNPGMIVTDFYMPQVSGIEFMLEAVKIKPDTAFIVITGHGPEFVSKKLPNIPQLKCFLNKPLRWRTLAQEVCRHWCGQPRPTFRED